MNYSNITNIPLPLAVFLATDSYDHEDNVISATTLLRSIRQIVLSLRMDKENTLTDISSLISSRMGSAIHTAIEQAWLNPNQALKALGFNDKVINKIKINPDNPDPKDINVYMEKRSKREVLGYTISGKFDFVAEGKVQDFKSTSVWNYMNQSNADKYRLQGSIYRWLNPDIITKDTMTIHYIFTDWSMAESRRNKDYPASRVISQEYPLMSLQQTNQYIHDKVKQIDLYKDAPESQLPLCTDDDLWRKPDVYKYYKDPNKLTRSTKNFDNSADAYAYKATQGNQGIVKLVKGQVSSCKYCPAFNLCSQKDTLINTGELTL
ncbi:hypothetical protein [Moraxella sp. ZY200743]|uniref:hypothetical protein n=1 Tax=Moraxella sp. ZY200743 TaxID=2911970 RepID=UPI003D7D5128